MKKKLQFEWFENPDEALVLIKKEIILGILPRIKESKLRFQLKQNKPIRVKTLKIILNNLKIDYSSFNKNIQALGGSKFVYPINLPLELDKIESVILVAAFMSDGSNQPQPLYANIGFLGEKITKAAQTIIPNIPWKIENKKVRFHKVLSRILTKLGVPEGNKTILNPKIPNFIYENTTYKKEYLTQVFDDEGHAATRDSRKIVLGRSVAVHSLPTPFLESLIYTKKNYYNSLPEEIKQVVRMQPPNLLLMEYDLLNEFGIKSSMRCRGLTKYLETISADWVIEIAGRENLEKFNRNIGFSHPEKIKQMERYFSTCRENKITIKAEERK